MSVVDAAPPKVRPGGAVIELVEVERFKRVDRPIPEPGHGEVVVAMRELGICGTDVHMFHGRGDTYPHVVGHDGVGEVRAVGPEVENVEAGQRVTIDPVVSCGDCHVCRRGEVQLCPSMGYLGMIGPGLLAQYVCLPAVQVVPLRAGVSDHAATVLEPVTVTLHMLSRLSPLLSEPLPCAIVGGGPLGIIMAKLLSHYGYDPHLFEPLDRRRELAGSLGVWAHPPEPFDLGTGRRLVIETSAASAGVALADALCTPGSVVAIVGRAPESISPPSVLLKELTILGIKGGPRRYSEAIDLVADDVVDPAAVITHEFDWADTEEAFRFTSERPGEAVRTVLRGEWPG